jgi:hypothetical protein
MRNPITDSQPCHEQEQHASTGGWSHTLSPTCSATLTIGLCWLTCQRWPGLTPLSPLATSQICLPSLLLDSCPILLTRWALSILLEIELLQKWSCFKYRFWCCWNNLSWLNSMRLIFLCVFIAMYLNCIRSFGLHLLVIRPHRSLCPHLKISNLKEPDQACLWLFFLATIFGCLTLLLHSKYSSC